MANKRIKGFYWPYQFITNFGLPISFSVIDAIVFKENLGKVIKIETINNLKINEAKLFSMLFTLKYINILPSIFRLLK